MSHQLDGQPVYIGDAVYDVAFGAGRVTYLAPDLGLTVTFNTGRTSGYTPGGVSRRFTHRTLYWHNPVVTSPPKGASNWALVVAATTALVGALIRTGGVDDGGL